MNFVYMMSILLKGAGAVLEVLLQILIGRTLGLAGYGAYSAWINAADLLFWCLFSGLVKCNTFYLSGAPTSLGRFRQRYYGRYVAPVLLLIAAALLVSGRASLCVVAVITGLELAALDRSSALIARGQPLASLFGEYVLGRAVLVAGAAALAAAGRLSLPALLALYVAQYGAVLFFFLCRGGWQRGGADISEQVSLKKWGAYQRADILQAMIAQLPVVLQYVLGGAFEAGVVSVVLLVKKLINFISGPTAKVFLPEFSRLYRAGNRAEIRARFAAIMRLQMLFAGPLAVVLVGFPGVVLRILAEELTPYTGLFAACAAVFLAAVTLGPCSGVMQMTGSENQDNRLREIALLGMAAVMALFWGNRLSVLYGLCAQTAIEAAGKFLYVCRWMGRAPVSAKQVAVWWAVPAAAIAAARWLQLQDAFVPMLLFAGLALAGSAAVVYLWE